MTDPFIFRSLVFAIIEFTLAYLVLKKGRFETHLIAAILFFLGSYQLGEFIFLATGNAFGIQFAFFSTTLLPGLGLKLVENITDRNYGAAPVFLFGLAMAALLLITPDLVTGTTDHFCLVKYAKLTNLSHPMVLIWGIYYVLTLAATMFITLGNMMDGSQKKHQKILGLTLLAYISFFPVSYVLTVSLNLDSALITSFMCALAIMCAFILSWTSLNYPKLRN